MGSGGRRENSVAQQLPVPHAAGGDAEVAAWPIALRRVLSGYPAAALVLAAHFLIAAASVREKSNTFDELAHITAGYSYWEEHDYGLKLEEINGQLPQRWFALPLLPMKLNFPQDANRWSGSSVWAVGDRFFFELGNDVEKLLYRARCMNVLLSVGLGLLVYVWSRRLFGPGGGMISLLAYVTDPTILANGSMATSDLAAAGFFAASVGSLWRMFHKLSLGNFVCTWLALAGLFLSKTSAVLILPMGATLLIVRLLGRRPLTIGWKGGRTIRHRAAQAGILLGSLLFQAVLVAATIWAFYGFRYAAVSSPDEQADWGDTLTDAGTFGEAIKFAREHRLLPEAYLYGTAFIYQNAQIRSAFLNGDYSVKGWWYFFPYTFLVKTPLPTLAILVLAVAGAVWSWRQSRQVLWGAWQAFYATVPLWILLAVYWTSAINGRLNIGHRHILPTYPAMFILVGAVAHWFHQRGRLQRMMSAAVLVCMLALVGECFATYPDYLAYFNQTVGGAGQGYRHLVDSSLDWGQDLPGLKRWLREHDLDSPGKTSVFLAYFGTASPAYFQIRANELSSSKPRPLVPLDEGVYCISATALQQLYQKPAGRWRTQYEERYQEARKAIRPLQTADPVARWQLIESKGSTYWYQVIGQFEALRLGRLNAFLRQREPDANVGHSILIYRLTANDLREALLEGPVELDEASNSSLAPVGTGSAPSR